MRVRLYDRREVAKLLGVSAPRVSQIASEMGIQHTWALGAYRYKLSDVRRMQKRNTKPGVRKLNKGEK